MAALLFNEPHKTRRAQNHIWNYVALAVLACGSADVLEWHSDEDLSVVEQCQPVKLVKSIPMEHLSGMRSLLRCRLESFRNLEAGWDGYDAQPLEAAVYDNVAALIDLLSEKVLGEWKLFPSDNGTVLMVLKKRVIGTVNIGCSTVSYIAKDANGRIVKRGREKFDAAIVADLMSEIVDAFK